MIIWPIFANEGLPNLLPGYMEKVAQDVREAGGVLIFDEVQSAFGRSGKWWGHQHTNVVPDILVLGKPMGNGHPIAAAICRSELGNTFGGNPVSCAVGNAVLAVIERENLVDNAATVGAYLKNKLWELANKYEVIGDVRGSGLFLKHLKQLAEKALECRGLNGCVSLIKHREIAVFELRTQSGEQYAVRIHRANYAIAKQALIEGYRQHRALSDEKWAQLPLFMVARSFTYLGWVHTRSETETAKELTPMLVEMCIDVINQYLAD